MPKRGLLLFISYMVKLYRNRYLRKYQEDFLLHVWSKESTLDKLGHNLLQKYKNKYLWSSSGKKRKIASLKFSASKMMRYLLIRAVKKNSYFWANLQIINPDSYLTRKSQIKKLHLLKFRSLLSKLLITNRHSLFFKDLSLFSTNLFWFSWLKFSNNNFYTIIYVTYLLNWNRELDFSNFSKIMRQNGISFQYLNMKNIDSSQYIYKSSSMYKDSFFAKNLNTLNYNILQEDLKKVL